MQFTFDSLDEVLSFAQTVSKHTIGCQQKEFVALLDRVARSKDKIAAIKLFRSHFGLGLKESKEAVEQGEQFPPYPQPLLHDDVPF